LKTREAKQLETVRAWLKDQQNNGFFNGFIEEHMDFDKLDNKELEWYNLEWYQPQLEN